MACLLDVVIAQNEMLSQKQYRADTVNLVIIHVGLEVKVRIGREEEKKRRRGGRESERAWAREMELTGKGVRRPSLTRGAHRRVDWLVTRW
ncbi:hypothetical protein TEQG_08857 [Trichophyton equinum CBS 127.97]|uniref:Uncharacterized protein n=1 Tax=Trichophyton equinum (strain ATCC MYA-4606 / CBS 127.97) TaxID=559882 RepID=F2Q603_TRIEC|nr:hypothetical protein TEQG_08857 [Trichophyton equinum CBS 127.97]